MFRSCLIALAFAAGSLAGGLAEAAEETPAAFLHAIYDTYGGESSGGVMLDTPEAVARYFTPDLAAIINADDAAAEASGDVPLLDGDPFISAQDWDIADLKIDVAETDASHATGTVSFTNFGESTTVKLDLVTTSDGWRIDDIHWDDGYGLRQMYSEGGGGGD